MGPLGPSVWAAAPWGGSVRLVDWPQTKVAWSPVLGIGASLVCKAGCGPGLTQALLLSLRPQRRTWSRQILLGSVGTTSHEGTSLCSQRSRIQDTATPTATAALWALHSVPPVRSLLGTSESLHVGHSEGLRQACEHLLRAKSRHRYGGRAYLQPPRWALGSRADSGNPGPDSRHASQSCTHVNPVNPQSPRGLGPSFQTGGI